MADGGVGGEKDVVALAVIHQPVADVGAVADGVGDLVGEDRCFAQLTLLMDEIFGEENYRNTIIIKRGAKNVRAQFDAVNKLASGYEYVLFYTRSPGQRFAKMVKEL